MCSEDICSNILQIRIVEYDQSDAPFVEKLVFFTLSVTQTFLHIRDNF